MTRKELNFNGLNGRKDQIILFLLRNSLIF